MVTSPRLGRRPRGRIGNTRKLLATAASIMSVMLILSSFVTTLLIAPEDYRTSGKASGRAIAFLAHKYIGAGFGTVYDLSTILILGLAGASAMAGLLAPDSALSAAVRHGAALGIALPPARARAVRHRRCYYAGLPRECGSPERCLRDRCVWCSSCRPPSRRLLRCGASDVG